MRRALKSAVWTLVLCLAVGMAVVPATAQPVQVKAAQPAGSGNGQQAEAAQSGGPAEQMDAPETEKQHRDYLYSSSVKWAAKKLGLSVGTMAQIFEWLNSGILLFAIFYFLFKALPKIFRRRSERLARDLVEARKESDDAKRRLAAIEERLSHLDAEIEAFRVRSQHEAAEEERRMHEALEAERQRIVHSAEQEIEAASALAQRSLRRHATELAVGQVRSSLKVDVSRDKALVDEFTKSIVGDGKGGRS